MSSGCAVFVIGPAGSGKTTFCTAMMQHCESIGRVSHLINLDPAAEEFEIPPSKDIRELITVEELMTEFSLGPNGGLVAAYEYLLENGEWLEEDLGQYSDEFLLVDCPGQIELFTHSNLMSQVVGMFEKADYRVCVVYLMESMFLQEVSKYFAGLLNATSAMLQLGVPHLNVISKMDLLQTADEEGDDSENVLEDCHELHKYFCPDPAFLLTKLSKSVRPQFLRLNEALVQLLDEYDMVQFIPLNIKRESSLENILLQIDLATQFYDNIEPKEPKEDFNDFDDDGPGELSDVD